MIEFGNQDHGHAIMCAVGLFFSPEGDRVVSRTGKSGDLLGGIVYQLYTGESISMHVASFAPNWINKDLLWVAFHYPFIQLGCGKVFGFVKSNDSETMDFDRKLGFNTRVVIPGMYPGGVDLTVLEMRREDCRWLKLRGTSLRPGGEGLESGKEI